MPVNQMNKAVNIFILLFFFICVWQNTNAQGKAAVSIDDVFLHPPASAKPWVFWYWLHGAVSKEGITADLEAMKAVGIGGAYLMPIKDTSSAIPFQPQVRQLTSGWWEMVHFAMKEAKRLDLQLGIHVSDGFALAGGPWITPALSMQKLVWTKTFIHGGIHQKIILPQPETKENYYKDIGVFAYPANYTNDIEHDKIKPVITTSNGSDAAFLIDAGSKETFRSDNDCWIQYAYPKKITIRQIKIKKQNNAYQSQRFIIQSSEDGKVFTNIDTLHPPRHGWQDWDEAYTHAVKKITSKYIRFVWQKSGTEPGSEDLDAAKWKPVLRIQGIYPGEEPVINNYEAKNGSVWRIAALTDSLQVSVPDAVPINKIKNITAQLAPDGSLHWVAPPDENWVVVRIGHTSAGYSNTTGGGGRGLECDKFNPDAVLLQFNNWFEKFYSNTDKRLAAEVIKIFHVDSWECGSQNWSSNFAAAFRKKRGYDLTPWLLVMTGTPVKDAAASEKVLHDVRKTIAELVNDKFYATLARLAHEKGCAFSAESIAPTFVSDALMHYQYADIPMGEFWLNSPTHDKPNDMLDAISGAHIYGKNIVQAEAFTTLRTDWGEHPGNLKALGDRAFAEGINRLVLHVFMHNPWLDKKPGITLDGIGLFFQRGQTWFKQSKIWIEYLTRCQALLQLGKPVVDIGVFTGEEIPGRSILPERLVHTLPGIFGKAKVEEEAMRMQNDGQLQRQMPEGVSHSALMADPNNFHDALNGYQYGSFNPDILMKLKVKDGKVYTPTGASFSVLVIPGKEPMNPGAELSAATIKKLIQLAGEGAKIIVDSAYLKLLKRDNIFIEGPYKENSFEKLGVGKDLDFDHNGHRIAWTHRKLDDADIYFLSNQSAFEEQVELQFGVHNKIMETASFLDGKIYRYFDFSRTQNAEKHSITLSPFESRFIIFRMPLVNESIVFPMEEDPKTIDLSGNWKLKIPEKDTIKLERLTSWHLMQESTFKYYSGTAVYSKKFNVDPQQSRSDFSIQFDSVCNMATIKLNGIDCGTLWTPPFRLNITKAIKTGANNIEIEVTNTWRNRLKGDELLPVKQRSTYQNSPYSLSNKPLLPAGILGKVKIMIR
jgi:hypothetical protein